MAPSLTRNYELAEGIGDVVFTRKLRPSVVSCSFVSYLSYLFVVELGLTMLLSLGVWMWPSPAFMSSLSLLVGLVLCCGALEKMVGIGTWRVITGVTHTQIAWIAMYKGVGYTMGFVAPVVMVEASVTTFESGSLPRPANLRRQSLRHELLKTFNICWREIGDWFTLNFRHDGLLTRSLCYGWLSGNLGQPLLYHKEAING
jgi:hypothetical protein